MKGLIVMLDYWVPQTTRDLKKWINSYYSNRGMPKPRLAGMKKKRLCAIYYKLIGEVKKGDNCENK